MPSAAPSPGSDERTLDDVIAEQVSRGTVRVPPYPSTALRLQAVLARDYHVDELVAAMQTDQVFTGNLLRLANSAFYRRGREVTSIAGAAARVGSRELTRMAMASALGQVAAGQGALRPLRRRVWRESLAAALISEALARGSGEDPDAAFVAGLLHDVGKLLVLSAIEDALLRDVPAANASDADWWAVVERFHVQLGVALAERWKLPGVVGAVVLTHHEPRETAGPLTLTVMRADGVVALLEHEPEVTEPMLEALGLDSGAVSELLRLLPRLPALLDALEAPPDAPDRQ